MALNMGDGRLIIPVIERHFVSPIDHSPDLSIPIRGVEVGVFRGATSAALLRHFPLLHLLMVDSWEEFEITHPYRKSGDSAARQTWQEQSANFTAAADATMFAWQRRRVARMKSVEAAERHSDEGGFDFVFIDADHTLAAVRADIAAWWPLVKAGGLMLFHDFNHPRCRKNLWGVDQAVMEFAEGNGLVLNHQGSVAWLEKSSAKEGEVAA